MRAASLRGCRPLCGADLYELHTLIQNPTQTAGIFTYYNIGAKSAQDNPGRYLEIVMQAVTANDTTARLSCIMLVTR